MSQTCVCPLSPPSPPPLEPAPRESVSEQKLETKTFFLDQSNILFTGALSFLASFAVNSFVQSIFQISVPPGQSTKWQAVLYNFIYVVIVVTLAIGLMFPLARAKYKRDQIVKEKERLTPTLVSCVNCNQSMAGCSCQPNL